MNQKKPFSRDLLKIKDVDSTINEIVLKLRKEIMTNLRRFGAVIGLSGGIDSSVCLALAVKALKPDKVLGIIFPEHDSNPESEELAHELASKLKVKIIREEITPALTGFKCYQRRDEAVRRIFPDYDGKTYKMKIGVKASSMFRDLPPFFNLSVIDVDGDQHDNILPASDYLQIVAASNIKQRSRMSMVYYHAEANHYAVIGTPNKHEYEQGFFVKFGDGAADVMPIVSLYKTQVYQLAEQLGIPKKIIERTPTTDTYSAEQTQEEFFYQLPLKLMDLYWFAFENEYSPNEVAEVMGETEARVATLFRNLKRKRNTTDYLRMAPIRF